MSTAAPITGKTLYRPVRLISWPEVIEVEKMPMIAGSRASPDSVGEKPLTACR